MPFFTKKPVTIEARKFAMEIAEDERAWESLAEWCHGLTRGTKLPA